VAYDRVMYSDHHAGPVTSPTLLGNGGDASSTYQAVFVGLSLTR
jgi:hypothetical protein